MGSMYPDGGAGGPLKDSLFPRLKGIVQDINGTLNVEGLSRSFKARLEKLIESDGDRISH